jgi:hypothetical protein
MSNVVRCDPEAISEYDEQRDAETDNEPVDIVAAGKS